jgi:ubiquinone/menaquinone biosynthesis C-methylase UbiE
VLDGMPYLFDEAAVRGLDWLSRLSYDLTAPLHDYAVRFLLPVLQLEGASREHYMRRVDLGTLTPRDDGQPVRVLEVGVGAGANLPLIERDLPHGLAAEIWGLDLSTGMMAQCRQRLASHEGRRVRLLLADAHALPFAAATFDRVFHVGGIAAYRDPQRGLAEMARVARPGTPIVVVDEQLDPNRSHWWHQRLMFRLMALTGALPEAPVELLPPGASHVLNEQTTRFYYCLTFRMRAARAARRPLSGRRERGTSVPRISTPG